MKSQPLFRVICRHVARACRAKSRNRNGSDSLMGFQDGAFTEALSLLRFALWGATPRERKLAGRFIREELASLHAAQAKYAATHQQAA